MLSSISQAFLIFDEATSALDYESERVIQQNKKRIAAGRTVFIIAHRLSSVRRADRIITVERGRIVEDGKVVMRHVTLQTETRYSSGDKALKVNERRA